MLPAATAISQQVAAALSEDMGAGDLTAQLIASDRLAQAQVICRENAVLCGSAWFEACFHHLQNDILIRWSAHDGDRIIPNQKVCELHGNARAILSAERCSLNFLQALSATATLTRHYVEAISGTKAIIMDTRKTIPGFRLAQKYAVTVGGGANQRIGLFDGILIKENHIEAAGGIAQVLTQASKYDAPIQIEVESLEQLETALQSGAKHILLDNFDLPSLRDAVAMTGNRAQLEASGGITLDNIRAVAETGVHRISVGSLTKDIRAIDFSMRIVA